MDKNLEYYLAQARRIAEHREKGAMQGIRKEYKNLMQSLNHFIADEYAQYAADDKLTYAILQRNGEYARFLEETTSLVEDWYPKMSKQAKSVVEEMYKISFKGMVDAVEKSSTSAELAENLKGLRNVTPEAIKRVVENPIHGLTLDDTLEKNRKEIVYEIKRELGVGLANGDRYSTMAKRLTERVDISYRKAVTVVRTEGHRVSEAGFHDAGTDINETLKKGQTAQRMYKTWCSMKDERVRKGSKANHKKMNGVSVPLDEQFYLGHGVYAEAPGQSGNAANDINCRCFLKYELKEDAEVAKKLQEEAKKAAEEAAKPKYTYVTQKQLKENIAEAQKKLDEISAIDFDTKVNSISDKDSLVNAMVNFFEHGDESLKKYFVEDLAKMSDNDTLLDYVKYEEGLFSKKQGEAFLKELNKNVNTDEADELKKQIETWQTELDKKVQLAAKKQMQKKKKLAQQAIDEAQKKLNGVDVSKKYENIWYNPVTLEDWEAKKDKIQDKLDYFNDKLHDAQTPEEELKWLSLIDDTQDFDFKGKQYHEIKRQLKEAEAELKKAEEALAGKKTATGFEDAFTQDRKDKALWTTSQSEVDSKLRPVTSRVWKEATQDERYAAYDYTSGSGKFNRPLSGFEGDWYTNKGVGNVSLNYEGAADEIEKLTTLISKSTQDVDVWLQRGCGTEAMESFFNLQSYSFGRMSHDELQQFVGQSNRIYSFTSCGSAKGTGFSNEVILNIYCPKGTQMMYVEPFSHYGGGKYDGGGLNWDGDKMQSSFDSEFETIIQRGASYTVTKIEKSGGTIYIDLEVHPENGYEFIK